MFDRVAHRGGGGASKFDFRNHAAWTPQRSRHPSTRRGGGGGKPSKFDFRNHAAWTPQRSRHPSTRRGGGGRIQNSLARNMHLQVDKQQPNTTEIAPDGQGQRQVRQRPLQTSTGRAKHDTCHSKRTGRAPNTTPADPNVILSTLWDVKRSTAQRKKPHALWYYLFRLRREGTASPGGAARDSRRGLTLDGAMACDKQTGPARPWQTDRSLSNDGNASSLCLGFRV